MAGEIIVKIPAGSAESEPVNLNFITNKALGYVATKDTITGGGVMKCLAKLRNERWTDTYIPYYNSDTAADASIIVVKDKVIPFAPFVDVRALGWVKFQLDAAQVQDVYLEFGLTEL